MSKPNNPKSPIASKKSSSSGCNTKTCKNIPEIRLENEPLGDEYFNSPSTSSPFCSTTCQNSPPVKGNINRLEPDNANVRFMNPQDSSFLTAPNNSPEEISDIRPPDYVPKQIVYPEIRVNYELVEDEENRLAQIEKANQNSSQRQNQDNSQPQDPNFLSAENFPIYKDSRISEKSSKDSKLSEKSSKSTYSKFKSRIPKRTSTPRLTPELEARTNSFILNAKNDSINMLSVAISTVMLLASDRVIPENYRRCSTKYFQLIKNDNSENPPNVKKILELLNPGTIASQLQKTKKGGVTCSCTKQVIVPKYKK